MTFATNLSPAQVSSPHGRSRESAAATVSHQPVDRYAHWNKKSFLTRLLNQNGHRCQYDLGYRYRLLKKTGISDTGTGFKKTGTIRKTKARIRLWYYISSSADPAHNR
jgi:hypothetical protein